MLYFLPYLSPHTIDVDCCWCQLWLVTGLTLFACSCVILSLFPGPYYASVAPSPMIPIIHPVYLSCSPCFPIISRASSKNQSIWSCYRLRQWLRIIHVFLLSCYRPWWLISITVAFMLSVTMESDILRARTFPWQLLRPLLPSWYCLVTLNVALFPDVFVLSLLFMWWIVFLIFRNHNYYQRHLEY